MGVTRLNHAVSYVTGLRPSAEFPTNVPQVGMTPDLARGKRRYGARTHGGVGISTPASA